MSRLYSVLKSEVLLRRLRVYPVFSHLHQQLRFLPGGDRQAGAGDSSAGETQSRQCRHLLGGSLRDGRQREGETAIHTLRVRADRGARCRRVQGRSGILS